MAAVLVHHVVGDLTVGKPDLAEFSHTETVAAALRAVADCSEAAITVWRPAAGVEPPAARFVGLVSAAELVAFVAAATAAGGDHERAVQAPVSEVVAPNQGLLKEVDPGTRSR